MLCYSTVRSSDFCAHAAALAVEGIAAVGRENLLPPDGRPIRPLADCGRFGPPGTQLCLSDRRALRPRHLSPGLSARNATPARAPATSSASR